jgi:hypothetical protein
MEPNKKSILIGWQRENVENIATWALEVFSPSFVLGFVFGVIIYCIINI